MGSDPVPSAARAPMSNAEKLVPHCAKPRQQLDLGEQSLIAIRMAADPVEGEHTAASTIRDTFAKEDSFVA